MKQYFAVFAAVVLVVQAAKVPSEVIQQVVVPVPNGVLAVAPSTTSQPKVPPKTGKTETPAQVVEVAKDQVHVPNKEAVVMTTLQPETKTMNVMTTMTAPAVAINEVKRKSRAVPFTDMEKAKTHHMQHNDMNAMRSQKKPTMLSKMPLHRSMRSIETTTQVPVTIQPVKVTENPTVKSADSTIQSTIDPCDLLCTKFEFEPICATNSLCLHEFPNQCILETYNCKHPSGKFSATKDDRCQMEWLNKCDESEMI